MYFISVFQAPKPFTKRHLQEQNTLNYNTPENLLKNAASICRNILRYVNSLQNFPTEQATSLFCPVLSCFVLFCPCSDLLEAPWRYEDT